MPCDAHEVGGVSRVVRQSSPASPDSSRNDAPATVTDLGLLVVGLGTLLAPFDTAVNIAFPSITRAFELSLEDIRWVVIAYVLTYASLMLACGRLGDLVGLPPDFSTRASRSACSGSLPARWRRTMALLLVGRLLQGIGIALTLSCGPALVTSLIGRERARARAGVLCRRDRHRRRPRPHRRRRPGRTLGLAGCVLVSRADRHC